MNTTTHDIEVKSLVNRKPCCGDVRIGKMVLRPGDGTEVEVTITARQEFGEIIHEATVLTEPPELPEIVLRSIAQVYPRIRIEELTPASGTVLLSSDKPKTLEFRVHVYGSPAEPPIDLGQVELSSTIKVDWTGLKGDDDSEAGLSLRTRGFSAVLASGGPLGEHRAEIVLLNQGRACFTHVVSWETVSPIVSSPKMIVMKHEEMDRRVVIHSRDHKRFRITRIDCKVFGVHGHISSAEAADSHLLKLNGQVTLLPESRRGIITVCTDHPGQKELDVPIVVVD